MNFLDHFKGRTQRIPREGYLNLFGLESNRVVQNPQISKSKLNQSLQKYNKKKPNCKMKLWKLMSISQKDIRKSLQKLPLQDLSPQKFQCYQKCKIYLKILNYDVYSYNCEFVK